MSTSRAPREYHIYMVKSTWMGLQIAVVIAPISQSMPGLPDKRCKEMQYNWFPSCGFVIASVFQSHTCIVCNLYSAVSKRPLGFASMFSFGSALSYRCWPEVDNQKRAVSQAGITDLSTILSNRFGGGHWSHFECGFNGEGNWQINMGNNYPIKTCQLSSCKMHTMLLI